MKQTTYTPAEETDAKAILYMDELIAIGIAQPNQRIERCEDCGEHGLIRAAIFGESYCRRCVDGLWEPETEN